MTYQRTSIPDFALANPVYANAVVTAHQVDPVTFAKLPTLAPLYKQTTGITQHENPHRLDSQGKFAAPVYHDEPVILDIIGAGLVGSHETGVIIPQLQPADFLPAGLDNLLRNGDFERWTHATSINFSGFAADGWRFNSAGPGGSYSRQAFADGQSEVPYGPRYFARIQYVSTPSGEVLLTQYLPDVRKFAGRKFALSWYGKAAAALTLTVRLIQFFGKGATASGKVNIDKTRALGTAWEPHDLVYDLPSIAGKTIDGDSYLAVQFRMPQQIFTVDFAKVKFQHGGEATPPLPKDPAFEAQACRRYFRRYQTQQNVQNLGHEMHRQPTESGVGPYDYDAEIDFE